MSKRSYDLLQENLPPYLSDLMVEHLGGAAWPVAAIPAVIEAARAASLVSLGGDLQINSPGGLWESPNVGVRVFPQDRSTANAPADSAAAVALSKFMALGGEAVFLEEAMAGWPGAHSAGADLGKQLFFSWVVEIGID